MRKVLECDHEAPRELRATAALGDEWTCNLVSMGQADALPGGVRCRLQDAIWDADKAQNDNGIQREERNQQVELGQQQPSVNL